MCPSAPRGAQEIGAAQWLPVSTRSHGDKQPPHVAHSMLRGEGGAISRSVGRCLPNAGQLRSKSRRCGPNPCRSSADMGPSTGRTRARSARSGDKSVNIGRCGHGQVWVDFDRLRADVGRCRPLRPGIDTNIRRQQWPGVDQHWLKFGHDWPDFDQFCARLEQQWPDIDQHWPEFGQTWPEFRQGWPEVDKTWPERDQTWPRHDQRCSDVDQLGPISAKSGPPRKTER